MLCAVLYGVNDVRMEDRPIPQPKAGEVLVKVSRVGVCGSDIHYYRHGRIGDFCVREPMILGHECAGTVVSLGEGVTSHHEGQRVALEPGYPCRECMYCKSGHYNLCPDVTFMATPPIDGAFCEYIAWPADFAFPLIDALSFEEGAMMEPLSVGMWAAHRGQVAPGDSVAVFGAGTIGLCALQAAAAAGATTRIAVDIVPYRLDQARRLGATHVLDARSLDPVSTIQEITSEITGMPPHYAGADITFETAGAVPTTRNALAAVRPGGVAVLVGLPADPMVELDIVAAGSKEIDIRGQFRYANRYPSALALVSDSRIDIASMVTHHFDLKHAEDALIFADEHKAKALKVMVDIDD